MDNLKILPVETYVYVLIENEIYKTKIKEINIAKKIKYLTDSSHKWYDKENVHTSLKEAIRYLEYKAIERNVISTLADLKIELPALTELKRIEAHITNLTNVDIVTISKNYYNNPKINYIRILLIEQIVSFIKYNIERNIKINIKDMANIVIKDMANIVIQIIDKQLDKNKLNDIDLCKELRKTYIFKYTTLLIKQLKCKKRN